MSDRWVGLAVVFAIVAVFTIILLIPRPEEYGGDRPFVRTMSWYTGDKAALITRDGEFRLAVNGPERCGHWREKNGVITAAWTDGRLPASDTYQWSLYKNGTVLALHGRNPLNNQTETLSF